MKKNLLVPVWILLLSSVFAIGFYIGENTKPSVERIQGLDNKLSDQVNVDFGLFWDAWLVIEEKYVNKDSLNHQQMVYGAIEGLLGSLDDPYSVFMEPQTSKKFLDDISGSFSGIGAEVGIRQGVLTVISPLEGAPAKISGLRPGDRILEIDGESTLDFTLDESVNKIRGEKGTEVSLLIDRDEWDDVRTINIVRDDIQIPVLKWEVKEDGIMYVQLYHFTENISGEFRRAVNEANEKYDIKGVILDVRNNPGGYLETAVDVSSWFLPKGELIVTESFGEEKNNNYFRSRGYSLFEDTPVVILINEGSASASEILAGALRDNRNIQIVGKKSFGKGSVQQMEKLKDGSSVKITVAKWLTPSGTSISEEGIVPDFEIEITSEDIDNMRDPQLEKALELFR